MYGIFFLFKFRLKRACSLHSTCVTRRLPIRRRSNKVRTEKKTWEKIPTAVANTNTLWGADFGRWSTAVSENDLKKAKTKENDPDSRGNSPVDRRRYIRRCYRPSGVREIGKISIGWKFNTKWKKKLCVCTKHFDGVVRKNTFWEPLIRKHFIIRFTSVDSLLWGF